MTIHILQVDISLDISWFPLQIYRYLNFTFRKSIKTKSLFSTVDLNSSYISIQRSSSFLYPGLNLYTIQPIKIFERLSVLHVEPHALLVVTKGCFLFTCITYGMSFHVSNYQISFYSWIYGLERAVFNLRSFLPYTHFCLLSLSWHWQPKSRQSFMMQFKLQFQHNSLLECHSNPET